MCDLMEMGVMFTRVNISLSHATQPLYQGHLQYFSELIKNYFQNLVLKLQFEESLFSMELLKKGWLYVSIYLSETVSIYLSAIVDNVSFGNPTHYMASESEDFGGADWIPYESSPFFTVSDGYGLKTVFMKVKNQDGDSAVKKDQIEILTDHENDGIPDIYDPDDDNDKIPDEYENENGLDPLDSSDASEDFDNDQLTNLEEFNWGTDIRKKDTDDDGWNDYEEINTYQTDPSDPDNDDDGLRDSFDPYPKNPYHFAVSESFRVSGWSFAEGGARRNGAIFNISDLVGGLSSPCIFTDSDNDYLPNFIENATCSFADLSDTDTDAILDGIEDTNRNGVIDANETSPCNWDTDGDLIGDGIEDANRNGIRDSGETDPCSADSDADGLTDSQEDANRNGVVDPGETDPNDNDSDNDGYFDGDEIMANTNPLSDASSPVIVCTDTNGLCPACDQIVAHCEKRIDSAIEYGKSNAPEGSIALIKVGSSMYTEGTYTIEGSTLLIFQNCSAYLK